MSLRDLVSGSDMCTASGADGAGPSNAVGALVNQLIGGASKTQEQLRDLPAHHHQHGGAGPSSVAMTPHAAAAAAAAAGGGAHAHMAIPGLAPPHTQMGAAQLDAFFHGVPPQQQHMRPPGFGGANDLVAEFEAFRLSQPPQQQMLPPQPHGAPPPFAGPPPLLPGPPPALGAQLRAFVDSARSRSHFAAPPLPPQALFGGAGGAAVTPADQARIRDRATILARQLYAERGGAFADAQVAALLQSLSIDAGALPGALPHVYGADLHEAWQAASGGGGASAGRYAPPGAEAEAAAHWEALWRERQDAARAAAAAAGPRPVSTGWAGEFEQQQQHPGGASRGPAGWADEFAEAAAPPSAWASEFEQQQQEAAAAGPRAAVSAAEGAGAAARLASVLAADADPKMRNSQFLQFVSKMSKGELLFEDNRVVEAAAPGGDAWAAEFGGGAAAAAAARPADAWAAEFERNGGASAATAARPSGGDWADEFARSVADVDFGPSSAAEMDEAWAALGATGGVPAEWASEFDAARAGEAIPGLDGAQQAEWESIWDRGAGAPHAPGVNAHGRGEYVFAADNPFLGDAQAYDKGRDLFKRGLLSEAALALEAEVVAHPDNADAWRLLGTVHAENDDDRQAIAAMDKALEAGPQNLDVLLSLGVSHTNELDQGEALSYLSRWLAHHPTHRGAAEAAGLPIDSSQALSHTVRAFEAAAAAAPAPDAELHMALGVLHHLGRRYDGAVAAFKTALELRPQDYSLWNKLGATLANHNHSADAIGAYQQALAIKPNYMRAWTNMGISYANVGDYDQSARYYVRALALNPAAGHVWGYLRTSLACGGRGDLMAAVDAEDLGALQGALPMQ